MVELGKFSQLKDMAKWLKQGTVLTKPGRQNVWDKIQGPGKKKKKMDFTYCGEFLAEGYQTGKEQSCDMRQFKHDFPG